MGPTLIVVPNELSKRPAQVLFVEDNHTVQTLVARCPNPAFRVSIQVR